MQEEKGTQPESVIQPPVKENPPVNLVVPPANSKPPFPTLIIAASIPILIIGVVVFFAFSFYGTKQSIQQNYTDSSSENQSTSETISDETQQADINIQKKPPTSIPTSKPTNTPIPTKTPTPTPIPPTPTPIPFSVSYVDPGYLPLRYFELGKVQMSVNGGGFKPGAKVSFVVENGTRSYDLLSPTYTPTKISGTMPAGLSNDYYKVVVTNPDGASVSRNMVLLRGGDPNEQ